MTLRDTRPDSRSKYGRGIYLSNGRYRVRLGSRQTDFGTYELLEDAVKVRDEVLARVGEQGEDVKSVQKAIRARGAHSTWRQRQNYLGGGNYRNDVKRTVVPGEKVNDLTVIEETEPRHFGDSRQRLKRMVAVRCICGREFEAQMTNVYLGHTKSCGCIRGKARRYPPGEVAKNLLWLAYRKRARNGGYPITLTREQFLFITQMDCHYCGRPPSNRYSDIRGDGVYVYSGLDRLDPKKGYEHGNVVPCCWTCNTAKHKLSYDEFIALVRKINERIENGELVLPRG